MLRVSILIPLYNSERFITQTIESTLEQTYKNIEIIIVDDGSTDNSYNIAKKYKSDKVKVYRQKNKGASAARNKAFELCSGDLIQYLDADDILDKDKIKFQVERYLNCNDKNIIINGIWGRFKDKRNNIKWEKQIINKNYNTPIKLLIDSWNGKGMMALHSWLVPKEIIIKAGKWNKNLSLNDDGEFFCRVILNANKILFVNESKVYYRADNQNSLSNTKDLRALESELNSYKLYTKYTLSKYNDPDLKKALANNFLNYIYQYYSIDKELILDAISEFEKLNVGKMWPVGGKYFKYAASKIGFINALKLRNIKQITKNYYDNFSSGRWIS